MNFHDPATAHGPDATCNICVYDRERRLRAFESGKGMFRHSPPIWLGRPYTLGNSVLWPLAVICWSLPVVWRIGNRISDLRFLLYDRALRLGVDLDG